MLNGSYTIDVSDLQPVFAVPDLDDCRVGISPVGFFDVCVDLDVEADGAGKIGGTVSTTIDGFAEGLPLVGTLSGPVRGAMKAAKRFPVTTADSKGELAGEWTFGGLPVAASANALILTTIGHNGGGVTINVELKVKVKGVGGTIIAIGPFQPGAVDGSWSVYLDVATAAPPPRAPRRDLTDHRLSDVLPETQPILPLLRNSRRRARPSRGRSTPTTDEDEFPRA